LRRLENVASLTEQQRRAILLSSQLFGVSSFDATVLALTVVSLGSAALVASWLPARRASRVDPNTALRA
jgi:putative ABC transport system permease protein